MNEPITKPIEVKFRGKTSSEEYNTSENQKYHDILSLYKASNGLLEKMTESHQAALIENFFLQEKIKELTNVATTQFNQLQAMNLKQSTGILEKIQERYARDFFTHDAAGAKLFPELEADHNVIGQFVTCAYINNIPKTYQFKNDGSIHVPKDLTVNVYQSNDKMALSHNGVAKIFNGNFSDIWQAKLIDPIGKAGYGKGEAIQLEILLPITISQQKKINTITLFPHPIQGVIIQNIEVYYNGNWTQIPGFHQRGIINQEGMHQWSFADMYAEKIRVTMRQRHAIEVAGEVTYYFGMQHMEVTYRSYSQTASYAIAEFDMSSEGLYTISGVTHTFLNREALSAGTHLDDDLIGSAYEYKVYKEAADGELLELSESEISGPLSYSKLWVKTSLKVDAYNGVPPCLHRIQLRYISH